MHNFATYSRDEQKPSRIICSSGQQMKTLQSSSCVCNPSQVLLSAELLFYELSRPSILMLKEESQIVKGTMGIYKF